MSRNRTGKDPVLTTSTHSAASACSPSVRLRKTLTRIPLHLRGLLRLARHRHALTAALLAGSATAAAVTVATVNHYGTPAAPLAAPRPAPTAAEALASAPQIKIKHHRLADALHLQGLAALHPLRGIASWYGSVWNGHKTASGETFDETRMTAAHKTLPLGTRVRVTNLRTLRSVIVRINDRGTLAPGRVIDLSSAAAEEIGMLRAGTAQVKLEVLPASI